MPKYLLRWKHGRKTVVVAWTASVYRAEVIRDHLSWGSGRFEILKLGDEVQGTFWASVQ